MMVMGAQGGYEFRAARGPLHFGSPGLRCELK
jgi:hypothetical protein